MFVACAKVQSLRFKMNKQERVAGKMIVVETEIKYREAPFSVYINTVSGDNKGLEILFNKGQNESKALINTGGFPYVSINLSPYGDKMREKNHYTVNEIGFNMLARSLKNGVVAMGSDFDKFYKHEGTLTWNGYQCDKIVMNNPAFGWVDYTMEKTMTLETFARGRSLSSHLIKEKNNLSGFGTIKAGTKIKIPNAFIKTLVLYIDKKTHLPVYQAMDDDKGAYERYEFLNLVVNPTYTENDFSSSNKAYHF